MTTNKEALVAAAVADINAVLSKEVLAAHDFNRIADVAKMGSAVCNAIGQPTEGVHFTRLIEESEYKAPNLYASLKERAFNGETVLAQKYNQVEATQTDIKLRMLGADSARAEDEVEVLKMRLAEAERAQAEIVAKASLTLGAGVIVKALPKPKKKTATRKKAKVKE